MYRNIEIRYFCDLLLIDTLSMSAKVERRPAITGQCNRYKPIMDSAIERLKRSHNKVESQVYVESYIELNI